MKKYFLSILIIIFLFSGCSLGKPQTPSNNNPEQKPSGNQKNPDQSGLQASLAAQGKIKKITDYDELKEFLNNNVADVSILTGRSYALDTVMAGEESASNVGLSDSAGTPAPTIMRQESKSVSAPGAAGTDYSRTNIQVAGVDEADIVKNDGKYIYAVTGKDLFIIEAYPAKDAKILSKIEFKSWPQEVYIQKDRLVVFGQNQAIYENESYKRFKRQSSFEFMKIFDISDRKNPKQLKDFDFEGSYLSSRLIGNKLYFITNNYNFYFADNYPVPRVLDGGIALPLDESPDIYFFDMPYQNSNFVNVYCVDIDDVSQPLKNQSYITPASQNVFVSPLNIYLTLTKYVSEYEIEMEVMKELLLPKLSASDQDKIARIEAVDNFILSKSEKIQKISQILLAHINGLSNDEQDNWQKQLEEKIKQKYSDLSKELEKTLIYKVSIKDNKIEYKTSGEVTGTVLNQYSMDEKDGNFRIATTKNRTWSRYQDQNQKDSYNNMYILDENLKQIGYIENIAPGERIYSARFMGDRAYLVTFQQTDPLFVIDMKDPSKPTILGKLKVPGFSNYLHPYDENTLIGIGKETIEQIEPNQPITDCAGQDCKIQPNFIARPRVTTKGIKISLFDVTNVEHPNETAKYELGDAGSDSIALYDPHAFLFSREKELLAIPVSLTNMENGNYYGQLAFSGAAIFKITKDSIELKGKIDHSDSGQAGKREDWIGYNYYDNTVKRILYIDDVLYTFSSKYLKMNNIDNLSSITALKLQKEENDFKIVN
jgi:inhibitor of cysteine peptidase